MNTIENTINTVMTEDTVEAVAQAVEAIPAKSINWAKVGKLGAVGGAVALIGAGAVAIIKHNKAKNQEKDEQEAAAGEIDNVKVAEKDFVEKDSETK